MSVGVLSRDVVETGDDGLLARLVSRTLSRRVHDHSFASVTDLLLVDPLDPLHPDVDSLKTPFERAIMEDFWPAKVEGYLVRGSEHPEGLLGALQALERQSCAAILGGVARAGETLEKALGFDPHGCPASLLVVDHLEVREDLRGRGVGSLALEAFLNTFGSQASQMAVYACPFLTPYEFLFEPSERQSAITRFYERHGFIKTPDHERLMFRRLDAEGLGATRETCRAQTDQAA